MTIDNPVAKVLVPTEKNLRETLHYLDQECNRKTCYPEDKSQLAFKKINESIAFSTFAVSKCPATTY